MFAFQYGKATWPGTKGLSLRVTEEPLTGPTDHWQPATSH